MQIFAGLREYTKSIAIHIIILIQTH
jgi:hypothetical protein